MPRSLRIRFEPKPRTNGRATTWGVYDRERASWPRSLPGFGEVAIDLPTREAAQAEADRLTTHFEKD